MPNPFAPDRNTLVAPMLRRLLARMSSLRTNHTSRNPKGMEPSRYATLTTIRYRAMVASGLSVAATVYPITVRWSSGKLGSDVYQDDFEVRSCGDPGADSLIAGSRCQSIGD